MLQYVVGSGRHEVTWYADPIGRAGRPHPLVALVALMSSALLIGLVAFGHVA